MPPASGLGAQLGIATEATSGTFVPPTTFLTLLSEGLETKPDYTKIPGLRPDVLVQQDGLHLQTTRHVEGDIVPVPLTAGLGKLLNLLTGATVTPTGAAAAKTFVFPIGASAPDGKSISIQVGVPGTDGTVQAFSVKGAVITSITFAMEKGGALTCTASIWGADADTTQTLATAVYPTGAEAFSFLSAVLQIDGAAPTALVTGFSITFAFPKASDRYGLNGSGTAATPITNAQIGVTGNYTLEFSGGWAHYNAFRNATRRSVTLTCSGKTDIVAGTKGSIAFSVPKHVITDNGTPTVSGPDIITTQPSWEAVADAAAPAATITYITADTAI
jgi:hypothetical protein